MKVLPKAENATSQNVKTTEVRDLKPKTKALIEILDNEPETSQTAAYQRLHPNASPETSKANARKILSSTNVIIYRKRANRLAKKTIVDIMKDKSIKPDTRLKAAIDIIDRTHGKPIQSVQSTNTNLNINVEASKELSDSFTAFLKQNTAT